jgi:hypothetical protein
LDSKSSGAFKLGVVVESWLDEAVLASFGSGFLLGRGRADVVDGWLRGDHRSGLLERLVHLGRVEGNRVVGEVVAEGAHVGGHCEWIERLSS